MASSHAMQKFVVSGDRSANDRIQCAILSGEPVKITGMYEQGGPQNVFELELHKIDVMSEETRQQLPSDEKWYGDKFEAEILRQSSRTKTVTRHKVCGYVNPNSGLGVVIVFVGRLRV